LAQVDSVVAPRFPPACPPSPGATSPAEMRRAAELGRQEGRRPSATHGVRVRAHSSGRGGLGCVPCLLLAAGVATVVMLASEQAFLAGAAAAAAPRPRDFLAPRSRVAMRVDPAKRASYAEREARFNSANIPAALGGGGGGGGGGPSFEAPSFELPQIEMPEVPKIELPEVSLPEVPAPAPPPPAAAMSASSMSAPAPSMGESDGGNPFQFLIDLIAGTTTTTTTTTTPPPNPLQSFFDALGR